MGIISRLFGNNKTDFKSLVDNGALILDVRSPQEFASGHIDGSVNMPLDKVNSQGSFLGKSGKPVITCCRSGVRSGMAKEILKKSGLEVYNGGSWDDLKQKIR